MMALACAKLFVGARRTCPHCEAGLRLAPRADGVLTVPQQPGATVLFGKSGVAATPQSRKRVIPEIARVFLTANISCRPDKPEQHKAVVAANHRALAGKARLPLRQERRPCASVAFGIGSTTCSRSALVGA